MIALDTNVLVRYLVRDDPGQAAAADAVFAELRTGRQGFIGREVVVELVWVLERSYKFGREAIAAVLEGLLAAPEIVVENADDLAEAIGRYERQGIGLADLMILAAARRAGAQPLISFDRRLARVPGVTVPGDSLGSENLTTS